MQGAEVKNACKKCGKRLSNDEVGIYKKMVNRGAVECLCIDCLSEELDIPTDELYELIEHFRRMGCTLFC